MINFSLYNHLDLTATIEFTSVRSIFFKRVAAKLTENRIYDDYNLQTEKGHVRIVVAQKRNRRPWI